MAINKAMYTGVSAIMDAYDRNSQTPYYSVWSGKDMIFSYNDDDSEQGRVYLMENLIASEQNEHSDILKIKFHPKKEKLFITDKTPSIATLFVRVCDPNYMRNTNLQPYNPQPNFALQSIMEKQNELMATLSNRLALLEEAQIEEEEESEEDDTLGKIGTILNHPVIQTFISAILPTLIPSVKNTIQPQVAGIKEEDEIQEMELYTEPKEVIIGDTNIDSIENSLKRLSKHTNTIEADLKALADMADNNPVQFKMFLSMLK